MLKLSWWLSVGMMSSNSPVLGNGRNSWNIVYSCFKQKVGIRWSFFLMFHRLGFSPPSKIPWSWHSVFGDIFCNQAWTGLSIRIWKYIFSMKTFPPSGSISWKTGFILLHWPTVSGLKPWPDNPSNFWKNTNSHRPRNWSLFELHASSSTCGGSLFVLVSSNSKQWMFLCPKKKLG